VSRENAAAKARRYLVEGRLTVLRVDSSGIEAQCRGNGAVYRVVYQDNVWRCSCPARSTCAHLYALMAVTVREVSP
jgi:SWIM zinc finger